MQTTFGKNRNVKLKLNENWRTIGNNYYNIMHNVTSMTY